MKLPTLSECAKAVTAVGGAAVQLVALGVLHGTVLHDVQIAAAVLTAVGVYLVPNGSSTVTPGAHEAGATVNPQQS